MLYAAWPAGSSTNEALMLHTCNLSTQDCLSEVWVLGILQINPDAAYLCLVLGVHGPIGSKDCSLYFCCTASRIAIRDVQGGQVQGFCQLSTDLIPSTSETCFKKLILGTHNNF